MGRLPSRGCPLCYVVRHSGVRATQLRHAGFPLQNALRFMLQCPDRHPLYGGSIHRGCCVGSALRAFVAPLASVPPVRREWSRRVRGTSRPAPDHQKRLPRQFAACCSTCHVFIGSPGAKPYLRLRRMHPQPWSSPTAISYQLRPSSRMSKHSSDSLCVKSERSNRHMSIILRLNQIANGLDFLKRQALRL
jgi:hypothetical protein